MNKEQEIKDICKLICATCAQFDGCAINCKAHRDTAEALYNAGYRKTFTSDFESDTQKAYKEGYIKGIEERESENERLTEMLKQGLYGYKPTITPKPSPPKSPTPSPKSISIDTVKEMNAMCNIAEQRKQAVKEFAEKLKANSVETKSPEWGFVDFVDVNEIDELLKEYEK